MLSSNDVSYFTGYPGKTNDDVSPKKKTNGISSDENVLGLKVKQLENQIKHIEEEKADLEQELYSK